MTPGHTPVPAGITHGNTWQPATGFSLVTLWGNPQNRPVPVTCTAFSRSCIFERSKHLLGLVIIRDWITSPDPGTLRSVAQVLVGPKGPPATWTDPWETSARIHKYFETSVLLDPRTSPFQVHYVMRDIFSPFQPLGLALTSEGKKILIWQFT
ncbi:hypothetical protein BDP27DRAFT_1368787 [Rhodocollybia butyracea]|uniref:Uncharacterized protein n=1 Tax=Rhodocollybia butyracea TaxID=206335 RepID=A0A9P5PG01_9AGAR|nr:hypothetical protein BDP27DRAFT_1368787 [Rhodocollybia butyracea]